ncbi:MAG: hypothetical protein BWY07_02325 [Candidatus Hydrogenedentes bacterium ADurb.Bin170]|nr:MAG: hypothetical protein BWY07_02325 [Candidatus Hydrogenedentes bacterium ADurb.Bin170]
MWLQAKSTEKAFLYRSCPQVHQFDLSIPGTRYFYNAYTALRCNCSYVWSGGRLVYLICPGGSPVFAEGLILLQQPRQSFIQNLHND